MKNLPIIHPSTRTQLPEIVVTIQGYPVERPNIHLELEYSSISYQGRQPMTPHTDKLLARAISKQANLIGWWLSYVHQCEANPTIAWDISRNFKVIIGPWNFTLRKELTRLSMRCFTEGKCNGEVGLIELD